MEVTDVQVVSGLGALTGAIVYLWKSLSSAQKAAEERARARAERLDEQHTEANKQIISLTEKVGFLTGVEEMSQRVILEVRSIKDERT